MKKGKPTKLTLSRETLRRLGEPELTGIAGGSLRPTFSGCPGSCLEAPPVSDEPYC
jgi:hypothetical protein